MMPSTLNKRKLLVLVGPTAVGKTNLSLELAEKFGCEIISGDSMQVYRGMDIGTAKATSEERKRIPHHMIDIHDPDHPFSVAEFQERVKQSIEEIVARNRLPFIVGGTGLYIESVCYDYQFPEGESDPAYREELRALAERDGTEALHQRLHQLDPTSAERIHSNDLRRIIRALEIIHIHGAAPTRQRRDDDKESPYQLCIIGLTMERDQLYDRINQRVDKMIAAGLIDEVQSLLDQGFHAELVSMQGLGYKEIATYLQGALTLEEAIELVKRRTRRFAKRQLSWFGRMKEIQWIDLRDHDKFMNHFDEINEILAGKLGLHRE